MRPLEDPMTDEAESKMAKEIADRRARLEAGEVERSIIIPVNQAFPVQQKVLTDEQVRKIMEGTEIVALTECGCRASIQNCSSPNDVCIVLGQTAEEFADNERYRVISIDEAMEVLDRTAEAGMVHLTIYSAGHVPDAICSCCSCCCHELKAMLDYGHLDHVLTSDFVVERDEDACLDCGTCIERCNFGAFEDTDDGVIFSQDRCFGCGVCVMTCASEAISLVERQ
jgi:Pyruvate/2-oxoacid:ferredoxin oxidoreductase delta subunit